MAALMANREFTMKLCLVCLCYSLVLLPLSLSAASIYQVKNRQAEVLYTDQPIGSKVSIGGPLVLKDDHANKILMETHGLNSAPVYLFKLVEPTSQQTIRNHRGQVLARIEVSPKLGAKDSIEWLLDHQVVAETTKTYIKLNHIERGTHTLQAKHYDKDHQVIQSTKEVVFYLHRPTILK